MTRLVVGVDGGGTRTRALVLDEDGQFRGRAEGRAAVADAADPASAAQSVADVVWAACQEAGTELPVAALWAGLSGAGRESARVAVELELSRMEVAGTVRVGTDILAAFHDAFGEDPGILVLSGTGSIAWGRATDGREGRVGGWGHHIGDEGSGYAIGQEALQWVARNADGRGPDTELRDAILAHLRFDEPDGLIQWSADASKGDIAALVPVVASAAEEGDALAQEILVRAAKNLQGHVLAILENLGPWEEPPGIALSGGLLQPGGPLRKLLLALLEEQHLPIVGQVPDPVRGAAQIALEMDRGSTA